MNRERLYIIMSILISIVGFIVFFSFPDIDIKIFGIGRHRLFLFHSAIIPALLFSLVRGIAWSEVLKIVLYSLCGSFSAAVGAHLFVDLFQPKSVTFIIVGTLVKGTLLDDNLWLLANTGVCIILCAILYKHIYEIITQHSRSRKR